MAQMPRPLNPPTPLLQMPTYALSLLGRDARSRMAQALPEGLRLGHLAVLGALAERSGQSQGAVAQSLAIHPTDIVAILEDLLERGLVERELDPSDRRRKLVEITPAGRQLVLTATSDSEQIMDELLAALDEQERLTVVRLLRRALPQKQDRGSAAGG